MPLHRPVAVVLAGLVYGSHAALATMPQTYPFTVRVTQQDNQGVCPAAGSLMPLRLTVDRAFPVTPPRNHTETYQGGPATNTPSPILGISINNSAANEPIMDDIYVEKNDRGVSGYTFQGFDFSTGVTITFSSSNAALVPTYRLPPTIFPKRFSTATFRFTGKERDCVGVIVAR